MKRWMIGASLVLLAPLAWALPTVAQVEAEVRQGHYGQAESMMQEVVAARPQSAKAHYVYAEILAHDDRLSQAAAEAARARAIDPSLKYGDPEKVRAFEHLLDREQRHARTDGTPLGGLGPSGSIGPGTTTTLAPSRRVEPGPAESRAVTRSGLPRWLWLAGLVALVLLGWRMLRRSGGSVGPVAAGPSYETGDAFALSPRAAPFGGSTSGSGLMGVGLAAAGGVAAGMLTEKLLERGHEQRGDATLYDRSFDGASDADARALEDRTVDFGSGNDWGDAPGSFDTGGGSDDGGGW
jgi:hypothetical protein